LLFPKEVGIDLPGLDEVFQLVQTCEGSEFEGFVRHADALKQVAQFSGAGQDISAASKARKLGMDFIKGHTVAAIIAAVAPKRQPAVRKGLGDDLRDLSDLIILLVIAHVKDLVMHDTSRGVEAAGDGLADIEKMYQRDAMACRRCSCGSRAWSRPRLRVVQDQVKSHARRWPVSSGIAQKGGRKIIIGHLREVALDEELTVGIGCLRVGGGFLHPEIIRSCPVHTA
jgi:hypothetical protein